MTSTNRQSSSRNMAAVLVVGLAVSAIGAFLLERNAPPAAATTDNPVLAAPVVTTTSTTATAAPPTTVAPAPAPVPTAKASRARRPVSVPREPYAPEAIRQIGSIEIPRIGLSHAVFEGITLRNIDHGPSHWPGTAMPGEIGNAVFAGHRVTHSHPFLKINELVEGDTVIFNIGDRRSEYVVTSHEIVTPRELRIVDQTDTPTATLFACHPPRSAKYRYVVHLALTGG